MIGYEMELMARDPSRPERPPGDPRGLYRGLRELAQAALDRIAEPPGVSVSARPYDGSLVVKSAAELVFEVALVLEVFAAWDEEKDASLRHALALEAHFATLGLKRAR